MKEIDFRHMSPEEKAECPGNVIVALVDKDMTVLDRLFRELDPICVHLLIQEYSIEKSKDEVRRQEDLLQDAYELLLGDDYARYLACPEDEKENLFGFRVEEHKVHHPYEIPRMVAAINDILDDEFSKHTRVYVSLSGTPAYAAAVATVVPQYGNAILFSCDPYRDECHDPYIFPEYFLPNGPVDLLQLKAFKLYCSIKPEERTNANVVRTLIYNGLWKIWKKDYGYEPTQNLEGNVKDTSVAMENIKDDSGWKKSPVPGANADEDIYRALQKKESVEFARYYLESWYAYEWLENDSEGMRRTRSSLRIRSTGLKHIDMFCSDKVYPVTKDIICPSGAFFVYSRNNIKKC